MIKRSLTPLHPSEKHALTRQASPTLRLLVVNQFGINVGFYMLIPYLATYLSVQIGLTAWLVGLILGVRNLGQQGMFLLGGTLADRLSFAAAGLLAVMGQAAIRRWCARLPEGLAPALGVAVMAAAFLPPAVFHTGIAAATAAVVCALLLTVGTLIGYPYEMQTIVKLSGNRLVATHYGLYQTIAGIGIAAGTAATGRAIDLAQAHSLPALPWLALATLAATCAWALHRLRRNTIAASTIEDDRAPPRSHGFVGRLGTGPLLSPPAFRRLLSW